MPFVNDMVLKLWKQMAKLAARERQGARRWRGGAEPAQPGIAARGHDGQNFAAGLENAVRFGGYALWSSGMMQQAVDANDIDGLGRQRQVGGQGLKEAPAQAPKFKVA